MNASGIGIDIIEFSRLERILSSRAGESFVEKNFTEREVCHSRNAASGLATSFAAKEAVFKAFGLGWSEGKEVEVARRKSGEPYARLHGRMKKIAKERNAEVLLSLSSTGCCAVAVAIVISS